MKVMLYDTKEELDFLRDHAKTHFDRFYAQREDIDEAYELNDWMYKCGINRGTYNTERRKWMPRYARGKANAGSTLMHRMVNTLAGILGEILLSGRDLWRYTDRRVAGNPDAGETGRYTADAMNALAKFIQNIDGFDHKIPEFCTSVFKQSNIFVHVFVNRVERYAWEPETIFENHGTDINGEPIVTATKTLAPRKAYEFAYPSISFPYPRNIYADKNIRDIKDQQVVLVLSTTTKQRLMSEGKYLNQDEVRQLDEEKLTWDGTYGGAGHDDEMDNLDRDGFTSSVGVLLRWDAYQWVPVQGRELMLDDNGDGPDGMKLLWTVWVGNTLEDAICLKVVDDFDPDNEIPIKAIRANSDESDILYHTFISEIIRPGYAADCTLLNTTLDNNAVRNDPPITVLEGAHSITDFTYKKGQVWTVRSHDAIQPHPPEDTSMQTAVLREQVREDVKLALATDPSKLGEYAKSHTSATEVMRVAGSTDVTIALRNAYIVGQLMPWLGRKYQSYARAYMEPKVIHQILGEYLPDPPKGEFLGEYDVVVDIVGKFQDDRERAMNMSQFMQTVSQNPALLNSATHRIDLGEAVRIWADSLNIPTGRLILPPNTADSEQNARNRIQNMLHLGQYIPPQEGEMYDVHLRVARAERLRWRGIEDDERAEHVDLIDQYIKDLEQFVQRGNQGQMSMGQPGMPQAAETPGRAEGTPIAARLGEMMGGENVG